VTDERDPLWRQLRAVIARADPVPPEVLRSAHDAFARRTGPVPRRRGWRRLLGRRRAGSGPR
jgi:hypothetical protein